MSNEIKELKEENKRLREQNTRLENALIKYIKKLEKGNSK